MKPKTISELEQEVMNIVWKCRGCSVREVREKLINKKKLAYTTIATILQRLYEKGLVNRDSKDSTLLYSPKISKETYGKKMAHLFINKFFSAFGDVAIASFAESIEKLPKKKKDYFLKLLEKHDKNQ